MTWNEYALAWAGEYGDDPRRAPRLARAWHLAGYHAGKCLAGLGIPSITCTVAGIGLAAAVPVAAAGGPVGLMICAVLVFSSTLAGCWARALMVLAPPQTRPAIGQATADWLAEVAWLAGFWIAGVPGALVAACLGLTGWHEYARKRAIDRPGRSRIKSGRPARVWLAATGLTLAGLTGPLGAAGSPAGLGLLTVAAAAWALLVLLGSGQRAEARR